MGRRLGIIIGVNTYQDAAFQPLHHAENDARALAQWLVNAKGGNWEPADLQLVQGAHATCELVLTLVQQICVKAAGPGDIVLIYFAGHAFVSAENGDGYLAFANTQYARPSTAVHLPSLAQQAMGASRAASVVCILDTFQTGPAWQARRTSAYDAMPLLGPAILNAVQQTANRFVLCSCRGNADAPEVGEKSLGGFVYRMLLGLCGPASEQASGKITLQSLHAFLLQALPAQLRPQLFGQERQSVVLVGEMPSLTPPPPSAGPPGGLAPPARLPAGLAAMAPASTALRVASGTLTAPADDAPARSSADEQQCIMLVKQARHLIQMHNPNEAFNLVEQALRLVPTDLAALILKGQLLGTVGRFEEALYVVGLVLQLQPNSALPWSMRAALLTNTGQYPLALQAIERSLELDPNNPETYSIKTSIMGQLAAQQGSKQSSHLRAVRGNADASFWRGAGAQLLGLIIGLGGAALQVVQPALPVALALVLLSLGLALLCVNAAHGAYRHGLASLLLTILTSGLAAAILASAVLLGGAEHIGTGRVYSLLQNHPNLLLPLVFLGGWLAAAALLPPLLALCSLPGRYIAASRRRRSS